MLSTEAAAEVSEFDRRVYRAIAAYAFDEAECHPSQERIADDLGCARESVSRAVRRLVKAGWLVVRKRWSWRSRWQHNVYDLLEPYAVSDLAMRRITRRAHNTARKRARRIAARLAANRPLRPDHTNPKGWCGCGWCKTDRASIRRPPPPLRGPLPLMVRLEQRLEDALRASRSRGR